MPMELSEQEIYEEARKRVKRKRDFYSHLGAYVIVNIVLVVIWALSGSGYMWFLWPLGIWGVFVLWNFIEVFLLDNVLSEKSAIEKEIEKMKREK
jgi:fatty acid desaturase